MSTYFDAFDTVIGGTGTDTLEFTDSGLGTNDLDGLSDIEAISLGSANTVIKLTESNLGAANQVDAVALGSTFTASFSTATTTSTLKFDGSAESNGKLSLTGGYGADSLVGGGGNDTLSVVLVMTPSPVAMALMSSRGYSTCG